MTELAQLVWKVLSGLPIEILDDNSVFHNEVWELVSPRVDTEYKGLRVIGSANMVAAYNLFHAKTMTKTSEKDTLTRFAEILEELQANRYIRRKPELVRNTFRTI